MSDVLLTFEHVGLAYRRALNPFESKNWVLKELNFEVYRGEVLGVIGRNGAGKSTLLRLLADIIAPNKGRIKRASSTRSQLLTLSLGFNDKLSGSDNTIMSLVTQGKTIREAKKLLKKVVDFAEIEHLMEHPVSTYSSGERSRLGFSIALQATPEILLLDEMLGVGDQNFKKKSTKALKERVDSDQTAVLVSHSAQTIREYCNRVLWIEDGEMKMLGDTESVINAYEKTAT
jgi:lipopolysaccharide transport system ATP-binding protein